MTAEIANLYDLDAERAVLGAVLIRASLYPLMSEQVDRGDFFREAHRFVFDAMAAIAESDHLKIDLVTTASALQVAGRLDEVGPAYLAEMTDGIPHIENLTFYAEIVRARARARIVIQGLDCIKAQIVQQRSLDGAPFASLDRLSALCQDDGVQAYANRFHTAEALASEGLEPEMILKPYVPAGAIGSMVAKVKAGKTTIALEMVRCLRRAEPFCGYPAPSEPVPVLYATEQPRASFMKQIRDAGLQVDADLIVTPIAEWAGIPWERISAAIVQHALARGVKLIVIDTASRWFGFRGDEENRSGGAEHVQLLQPFCAAGGSVILVRHARKSGGGLSDAARGTSAIEGAVDFILHVEIQGRHTDGLRRIDSVGRFEMPPSLVFRRHPHRRAGLYSGDGGEDPLYTFEQIRRGDAEGSAAPSGRSEQLVAALNIRPMTAKELTSQLQCGASTIDRELETLLQQERIAIVSRDGGKRSNALVYATVDRSSPSQTQRDEGGDVERL